MSKLREIAEAAALRFNITVDDLMSRSRHGELIRPRQFAYAMMFQHCKNLSTVARFFDRDPSTVRDGIDREFARLGMKRTIQKRRVALMFHSRRGGTETLPKQGENP